MQNAPGDFARSILRKLLIVNSLRSTLIFFLVKDVGVDVKYFIINYLLLCLKNMDSHGDSLRPLAGYHLSHLFPLFTDP